MSGRRVFLVVAPVAILVIAYLYFRRAAPPPPMPEAPAQTALSTGPRPPTAQIPSGVRDGAQAAPAAPAEGPSHLVDALNSPSTDIKADLRLLNDLFVTYRSSTHGEDPVGENAEITAVLMGRNALDFAFIPKDCPAVNSKGELCDRWGTPFFFHQLSGSEMEIRSAGPDKKLWTADDVVITP